MATIGEIVAARNDISPEDAKKYQAALMEVAGGSSAKAAVEKHGLNYWAFIKVKKKTLGYKPRKTGAKWRMPRKRYVRNSVPAAPRVNVPGNTSPATIVLDLRKLLMNVGLSEEKSNKIGMYVLEVLAEG